MRAAIVVAVIVAAATAAPAFQDKGGKKGKAPAAAPQKPEEVEAKVAEILDSFRGARSFSSDDPRVDRIVGLGRNAVPALLKLLRKYHAEEEGHSFRISAGTRALQALAVQADIPAIAALLEEGVTEAAGALQDLPAESVRPALLAPLRKGWCSHELLMELERHRGDAGACKAVREFLENYGLKGDAHAGAVAEWLGEAGDRESLPLLRKLLAAGGEDVHSRQQVAGALVALRDRDGLGVLVEIFATTPPRRHDGYARHRAGEILNRVAGERIYIGSYDPSAPKGNFDEAAPKFTAWWEKVKEKIRFDEKTGRWTWA